MAKRPYWQVAVSLLFSLLATGVVIVAGIKLVGFLMPFVVGWVIALIATPLVNWLEKRLNIVKKLGTALIVILVLGLIVMVIYLAVSRLGAEISSFIRNFPELYAQVEDGFSQIGHTLDGVFARLPAGIQNGWDAIVANLDQTAGEIMTSLSEPTVTAAGNFAKRLPSYLIAFIVAMMSAYLFTVQREEVISWWKKAAPPSLEKRVGLVADNLKYAVGGYFKAQFQIMGVVFLILWVALVVLGVHYAVLVAFLIAFLDFLPFFGTGTAMIPWALYELLTGDYKRAVVLIIVYIVTQLIHQLLQPKLMSSSMGLNPLVTLLLLYSGYKINSVLGMILAVPIGMIVINMVKAGAFDYILDDVKILVEGILGLREYEEKE